MPQSVVSQRFITCLNELKSKFIVKSDREFSLRLDFTSQNLSQIVKGKRDVTIELIRKAVEVFDFNADYIFSGEGDLFKTTAHNSSDGVSLSEIEFISHDDKQVYLEGLSEENRMALSPYNYSLTSSAKDVRLFEVGSNDLIPFFNNGDILICKNVGKQRWSRLIRDYHMYVIVTESDIVFTRVRNHIKKIGEIEILDFSKQEGESYFINPSEIIEIWEITHVLNRWRESLTKESLTLEERLDEINNYMSRNRQDILSLNLSMEKILKQLRDINSKGR